MIKEVNRFCEKLNNTLGIAIELPNPKKKTLKVAMVCNLIVGIGLAIAGIVFPSKPCMLLGGISVISSALLRREIRNP